MALKQSRRARRMQRHHARNRRSAGFNLVSLMDIFTILVFFLLVNSTEVQVLPNPRAMSLPESRADAAARSTPVIMLTRDRVLLNNQAIGPLNQLAADEDTIPDLTAALLSLVEPNAAETDGRRLPVTIMADKAHPFSLIEKVMRSCVEARRPEISLAVLQRGDGA